MTRVNRSEEKPTSSGWLALGKPCASAENATHVAMADMQITRRNSIDASLLRIDDLISFDRERAEVVMGLIIRRHREAGQAFRSLLDDMRDRPPTATRCQPLGVLSRPKQTERRSIVAESVDRKSFWIVLCVTFPNARRS